MITQDDDKPMEVTVSGAVLNYHHKSSDSLCGIQVRLTREIYTKLVTGKVTFDDVWEKGLIGDSQEKETIRK